MKSKSKRVAVAILFLALIAFLWQCTSWFGSATLRLTYYIKDDIYSVEDEVEMAEVDLSENEDWREHHDEIKNLTRILFAFWVINLADVDATAQFYTTTVCTLTTAQQVRDEATLVIDGVSIPANDSVYVTARDSYRYLRHVDELEDRIIEGQFCLYCIAESAPFEIEVPDSAAVIIEFTYVAD